MCGITGVVSPHSRDIIYPMTRSLIHRGPDEEGFYHDETISLGHRRLSIIDLSGGKQPISNERGNLQLVCNGEIYNSPELRQRLIRNGHLFKTRTDVEVILHLYEDFGVDCVKYLQGMFAFAIWNSEQKILFLARDHLGQKPLFYFQNGDVFLFASEIKAILASKLVKRDIDLDGLWHYISLRYLPDEYTLFKNIRKLPAASWLFLQNGKRTCHQYWDLNFSRKLPQNEEFIAEQLDALLQETVKMHLLSDVQVGAFLSGGIDSGLITAIMASMGSVSFPTFSIGVKEQSFNELPYARMVVQKYGLNSHEKIIEADLIHLIPSMVYHMDEPSDPFAAGVYLVSKLAGEVVKVVLGGDGGDENFAGYDRFAGNQLVDYYCILPLWFRKKIMKKIIDVIPESFGYKSLAQKAAWINEMSLFDKGERYAQSMSFLRFTQESKMALFTDEAQNKIGDADSVEKILKFFDANNAEELVDKMLFTDLMTRMPDHLLPIVDRMSMAHSIESRSPLVDYKIVGFAASIPPSLKLNGKNLKYILKKVASRYLPQEIIQRKKQGFGFPLGIWMRTELNEFLQNLFMQSRFVELGIFERDFVQKILSEHFSGKRDNNYRIWILLNLEIWYRIFFEEQSVEDVGFYINSLLNKKSLCQENLSPKLSA